MSKTHCARHRLSPRHLLRHLCLLAALIPGCIQDSSHDESMVTQSRGATRTILDHEKASETEFRALFAFHLAESGYGRDAINQAMFATPEAMRRRPEKKGLQNFLSEIDTLHMNADPATWHQAGVAQTLPLVKPVAGQGPVTLVVLPGFSSEFIKADPFEEILDRGDSVFARLARPKLEALDDTVYHVREQKEHSIKLSKVVRVGSYDRNGQAWVNVIMLTPRLGSLESLGTLASTVPIYQRRLDKIFKHLPNLGHVYLLGYSRGAMVGLELLRATQAEADRSRGQFQWIERIKGLISLGGVLYGSHLADEVFSNRSTPQDQARKILIQLVGRLEEEPRGLAGESLNKEVASRVWRNTQAYGAAVKQLATASVPQSQGKFVQLFAEENLRKSQHAREYPGLFANWDQTSALLTKLINTRCPFSCYFKNIRAFKQIITSVLDGAQSMTTSARMEWWKNAGLPRRFRILSLNATMPGPVQDGALSPIMALPHFGYTSPDFIFVQRPSYYVMLENGAGILNDSAVSYTRSRYWPELDPTNGRTYDQLGLLASHHFGIGFHAAITNCFRTPNSFPRAQLIAALGSYLRRYPQPP